eukprot:353466-Chlamydomonas_euryale.AAC.6
MPYQLEMHEVAAAAMEELRLYVPGSLNKHHHNDSHNEGLLAWRTHLSWTSFPTAFPDHSIPITFPGHSFCTAFPDHSSQPMNASPPHPFARSWPVWLSLTVAAGPLAAAS